MSQFQDPANSLDTAFIGILEERGVWAEKCAACGQCVLHLYGGICPITRCAKKMMNGPCSGFYAIFSKTGKPKQIIEAEKQITTKINEMSRLVGL